MKYLVQFLFVWFSCHSLAVESDPSLRITQAELACKTASDCVSVALACSCDYGTYINKSFEADVEKRAKEMCANYSGIYCKMRPAFLWPTCEKKICVTNMVYPGDCKTIKNKEVRDSCRKEIESH